MEATRARNLALTVGIEVNRIADKWVDHSKNQTLNPYHLTDILCQTSDILSASE